MLALLVIMGATAAISAKLYTNYDDNRAYRKAVAHAAAVQNAKQAKRNEKIAAQAALVAFRHECKMEQIAFDHECKMERWNGSKPRNARYISRATYTAERNSANGIH